MVQRFSLKLIYFYFLYKVSQRVGLCRGSEESVVLLEKWVLLYGCFLLLFFIKCSFFNINLFYDELNIVLQGAQGPAGPLGPKGEQVEFPGICISITYCFILKEPRLYSV